MRVLLVNGPNLNLLGARDPKMYGRITLPELERRVAERATALGAELRAFQSNHEGALIDWLQAERGAADAIIINAGALTHYGLSLRDALADTGLPIYEVHISNIHAREPFRHHSVIAAIARAQIAGLGWRGYLAALEAAVGILHDEQQGGADR